MDFKELSSRKVAGIPVVYLGAGVAVVGLYAAIRMRGSSSTDAAATDATDPTGDVPAGDIGADSSQPAFQANPSQVVSDGGTTDTNDAWSRRAVEWLVGQGNTATTASNAITKYLNSESLSLNENSLVQKAIKQFGLPPEGLSTSKVLGYKGPATKQGEPPTTHKVKGTSDNSAKELARLYYGLDNADAVNLIVAANGGLVEPYAVGTAIHIPRFHKPKYYRANSAHRTLYQIAAANATTAAEVQNLNPGIEFPVKVGTRVRVK